MIMGGADRQGKLSIGIDAQPLMDEEKTGIGWTAKMLTEQLIGRFGASSVILNYFSLHRTRAQLNAVRAYGPRGVRLNECKWFVQRVYKAIWRFIPLPYLLFYGAKSDVTLFFNYCIPPGVRGKKVAFVYDMVYKSFPETMDWKTRAMLETNMRNTVRRADLIVTISEFSKQEILRYFSLPEEKIAVVPCGVDRELFHSGYSETARRAAAQKYGISDRYFLYLGTLEPRKNILSLVEAYYLLTKARADCPLLVIAGRKGWLFEDIFRLVEQRGLGGRVVFTGYVSSEDVPLLMAGAKAFLFPSLYEGFGMPPLEAMACGTPVIASTAPAIREVAGDACLLADPSSPKALADAMERLCSDEALCRRLSQTGRERSSLFGWQHSGDLLVRALARL